MTLVLHPCASGNFNLASVSDDAGRFSQRAISVSFGRDLVAGWGGFVETYAFTPMDRDEATGVMAKNERGAFWVSKVTLHPQVVWGGDKVPTAEELDRLHHRSHEECFIANSVKTEVTVSAP